jgi:hypothetical protein
MDGIVDELLRLEDVKHHALIGLDSAMYDRSVREQAILLEDSRLSAEARQASDKLLAFSKLASLNSNLYQNLLTTTPWVANAAAYTGTGRISTTSIVPRSFSAEV